MQRSKVSGSAGSSASTSDTAVLLGTTTTHRLNEGRIPVVDEVGEGRRLRVLLPHEEEWDPGSQRDQGGGQADLLGFDQRRQPLTLGPVSHLIVVLDEIHDSARVREPSAGAPWRRRRKFER